jgi:hypothetical protein
MNKYEILVKILDNIRYESPENFKLFRADESDNDKVNLARSKSLIHLFLKVKFGLLDFNERNDFVTDEGADGGIDGYYIDHEKKEIYFIQSKFRINKENFENKAIKIEEVLKMHIKRIFKECKYYDRDINGTRYNGKICKLVDSIKSLKEPYIPKIFLLANNNLITMDQFKVLTGGYVPEIFDYNKVYSELVFPIIAGTFYNIKSFTFQFKLKPTSSKISYFVDTEEQRCEIIILFIPTIEIAKMMSKYKNTILHYNPRSYLSLKENDVNQDIRRSIIEKETNVFSLFNNGITIITNFAKTIEQAGNLLINVTNPQIINGGQTAYTLCNIYEDILKKRQSISIFDNKEVLVKIIDFNSENNDKRKKINLINEISKATNQQTPVLPPDRTSNDDYQLKMQEYFYSHFNYFYERKKGEFFDGIENKYIDDSLIINREQLFRIALACNLRPAESKKLSAEKIFTLEYNNIVQKTDYSKYFIGYLCYKYLEKKQNECKNNRGNEYGESQFGNALKYGIYAVVCVMSQFNKKVLKPNIEETTNQILLKWLDFENNIMKIKANESYFKYKKDEYGKNILVTNFSQYYRGRTLNDDIHNYFLKK